MKILLTGVTGFVGKRMLPRLLQRGHSVRCMVRDRLSPSATSLEQEYRDVTRVEFVEGNANDLESLKRAVDGCDSAYYLIHSMGKNGNFRELDRLCANNFVAATAGSSCKRMIYLSGLADEECGDLSDHLASRIEVGQILRAGSVQCVELRAAMIIGTGSISFRMIRHLCHRLPVMLCPKWLLTKTQPLAVEDLLKYLVKANELNSDASAVFEIGGADSATYLEVLKEYCKQNHLKRAMIPVPLLSPKLSAHWLRFVSPETADIGREMIDGLRNENLVRSTVTLETFGIEPMTIAEAIRAAVAEDRASSPPTSPQDSISDDNFPEAVCSI